MADEPNTKDDTTNPQPDPQAKPDTPAGGDAPTPEGKTYTEAEMNAMMATRLSKQEKALRKQLDEEQAEAKRKAEQTAEERAKELEAKLAEQEKAAEARVQAAERRAALAGKVTNPDRVLKLLDDPDEYFDGTTPKLDAILEAFPEYAPKNGSGTSPVDGVRGRSGSLTMDQIKQMTPQQVNERWEEVQAVMRQNR